MSFIKKILTGLTLSLIAATAATAKETISIAWGFSLASNQAKSRWVEGYRYIVDRIDPKWINFDDQGHPTSLSGFWSKWHQIG